MNSFLLKQTKKLLVQKFTSIPQIAIITGSGIKVFKEYNPTLEIKYNQLPIFNELTSKAQPLALSSKKSHTIKGHEGTLKLYKINNASVLVFSGRRHLYQGYDILDVTTTIKLAYELGVKKIIMTNAAGGISKKLKNGDLMLITGFIDLMQPTERGVLSGIILPPQEIKTKLTNQIKQKFKKYICSGVYAANIGPSYETYSEIRLLQSLGASAVGMSTIPEMICAKSLNLDFAGISVISNVWNPNHKPSHLEVLNAVTKANNKLNKLILNIIDN